MTELTRCPRCATEVTADTTHVAGNNFCSTCDEPLFWQPIPASSEPATSVESTAGGAQRQGDDQTWPEDRYPELYGRETGVKEHCWNCDEYNPPPPPGEEITCRLCKVTIPKPLPPTPEPMPTGPCGLRGGGEVRQPWEVHDWLLISLGIVLVLLVVWLIVLAL